MKLQRRWQRSLALRVTMVSALGWLLTVIVFACAHWAFRPTVEHERDSLNQAFQALTERSFKPERPSNVRQVASEAAADVVAYLRSQYGTTAAVTDEVLLHDSGLRDVLATHDHLLGPGGYTAMHTREFVNIVHPTPDIVGRDLRTLRSRDPHAMFSWWQLCETASNSGRSEGYYLWPQNNELRAKFMVCESVPDTHYIVAATTYLPEDVESLVKSVNEALESVATRINQDVRQGTLVGTVITVVVAVVVATSVFVLVARELAELADNRRRIETYWQYAGHSDLTRAIWHRVKGEMTNIGMAAAVAFKEMQGCGLSSTMRPQVVTALRDIPSQVKDVQDQLKSVVGSSGNRESATSETDFGQLVEEAVAGKAPFASSQGVRLSLRPLRCSFVVIGARATLRAAIENLLDNAIAVTTPGGSISVHVEPIRIGRKKLVRAAIRDAGPGFENLERAGEPGYSTRQGVGGWGMGIAIAQATALAHGGELILQNLECGARVCMQLPLERMKADSGRIGVHRPNASRHPARRASSAEV